MSQDPRDTTSAEEKGQLAKVIAERRAKVEEIRARGDNPFANDFKVSHLTDELISMYGDKSAEELDAAIEEGRAAQFSIAGRLMAKRSFGKVAFGSLRDRSGDLQLSFFKPELSAELWSAWRWF